MHTNTNFKSICLCTDVYPRVFIISIAQFTDMIISIKTVLVCFLEEQVEWLSDTGKGDAEAQRTHASTRSLLTTPSESLLRLIIITGLHRNLGHLGKTSSDSLNTCFTSIFLYYHGTAVKTVFFRE